MICKLHRNTKTRSTKTTKTGSTKTGNTNASKIKHLRACLGAFVTF